MLRAGGPCPCSAKPDEIVFHSRFARHPLWRTRTLSALFETSVFQASYRALCEDLDSIHTIEFSGPIAFISPESDIDFFVPVA
jgi:hypothetical protein